MDDMVKSNDAGLQRTMTNKYVFMIYSASYKPKEETTRCAGEYFIVPCSWPVQKNSPLLPVLNEMCVSTTCHIFPYIYAYSEMFIEVRMSSFPFVQLFTIVHRYFVLLPPTKTEALKWKPSVCLSVARLHKTTEWIMIKLKIELDFRKNSFILFFTGYGQEVSCFLRVYHMCETSRLN